MTAGLTVWESCTTAEGIVTLARPQDWRVITPGVELAELASLPPGRRVLLCRIQAGALLAEHTLPVDGVTFVMQGAGEMSFPGSPPRRYRAGDTLLVRAQVPHALQADDGADVLLGTALMA
ncbi:MAG: hypothetical protein ABI574_00620 [Burkholderiales bacterium]